MIEFSISAKRNIFQTLNPMAINGQEQVDQCHEQCLASILFHDWNVDRNFKTNKMLQFCHEFCDASGLVRQSVCDWRLRGLHNH